MKIQNNIILIGMPGSGKTTVSEALALTTGLNFYDIDFLIEKKIGKKITEIFSLYGEKYFRDLETETINEFLNLKENFILSTGGGIVEKEENLSILKKIGKVFYLEITPELIFDRIKNDTTRPLLLNDNPKQSLIDLYQKRHIKYEKADFKIDASKSLNEIMNEIIEKL